MSDRILNIQRCELTGQEISWAGKCPWTGTHCFRTEDGGFFMPPDLVPDTNNSDGRVIEGAINGIAFSGDVAAFSSPEEVTVWSRYETNPLRMRKLSISFTGGAHDVIASAHGG